MGPSGWVLEAVEGHYSGRRFRVTERGLTFGREADNDLILMDDNISRHHALVRISGEHPVLEDRNSRNGTFVNNQRVSRIRLREGDRIAVGTHLFVIRQLAEGEEAPDDEDLERTVVARPTPAQLRRTQAVQVFSPAARAYEEARRSRENLAASPASPAGSSRVTFEDAPGGPEDSAGGPILGGAAAPSGDSRSPASDQGLTLEPHVSAPAPSAPAPPVAPVAPVAPQGPLEPPPPETAAAPGAVEPISTPELPSASDAAPVPPDTSDLADFDPMPKPAVQDRSGTRKLAVVGGGTAAALILAMALYSQLASTPDTTPVAAQPTPAPVVSASKNDTAAMFQWKDGDADAPKPRVGLTEEEKALPKEERVSLANEHFDQGERYMESDKLMAALEEFEKALALNPECKVCVIRISKVEAEIRREIEKYKSDALRSYQAMEYDKAKRYWEMVLELERDPAGRRVAMDGLKKAIVQLKQQSYR